LLLMENFLLRPLVTFVFYSILLKNVFSFFPMILRYDNGE
jgi:hypothetical protein